MSILVVADHSNDALNGATLNAITAATQLNGDVHVLVAGMGAELAARQAGAIQGVTKIRHAESEIYAWPLAENIASLVVSIGREYSHILFPATTTGKDLAPRVAALLDAPQISDVTAIIDADSFRRPIYAGNIIATVSCKENLKILTIRQTAFAPANKEGGKAVIETLAAAHDARLSRFVSIEATKSERPDLSAARIVVSGGRGLGSKENFVILERLAEKLGAALGASRAAVDAGYVPNDYQVGQTGKIVAPDLYIAVGISGAIQHLAGMKDSKVIVAINKDENAPIFEIADYGLVGDLFRVLPELEAELAKA